MKQFGKNVKGVLAIGALAYTGWTWYAIGILTYGMIGNPSAMHYIREEQSGINASINQHFCMDDIGSPNIINQRDAYDSSVGGYYLDTDEISVFSAVTISPNNTLFDRLSVLLFDADEQLSIEEIYSHEYGHYLIDQILENEELGYLLTDELFCENPLLHIINEGIAQYIIRSAFDFGPHHEEFTIDDWPEDLSDIQPHTHPFIIYDGGYYLVKDILDLYGVDGIIYLFENPPLRSDSQDILGYQAKILNGLESNKTLKTQCEGFINNQNN